MSQPGHPDSSSLPLEVARQVDRVCNRFELYWRGGVPPRIEDFVRNGTNTVLLRELILLDSHYRRQRGESPRAGD